MGPSSGLLPPGQSVNGRAAGESRRGSEDEYIVREGGPKRRYRFGFVLSTALGNITRYQNLRKFAEREHDIDFVWAPVSHYLAHGEPDPYKWLPGVLRSRAILVQQAAPVLSRFASFDAVMIHMFEIDILTAVRGYVANAPLRIISADDAPVVDPDTYPLHPVDRQKPAWKRAVRLKIDLWRARRADLLMPFSRWAADIMTTGCGLDPERVVPIHVGLDLDLWHYTPKPLPPAGQRVKLLFVGGEFVRKGGADLLAAFIGGLSDTTELHLVTKSAPTALPAHVHVYADLGANEDRLRQLYREADVFVLPTTSDLSSWVILEAMASGCPVIATPVGGIVDLIDDGVTGTFVPVGDVPRLIGAINGLVENPAHRREMGEAGRRFVEQQFNAALNVPAILRKMKALVDKSSSGRRASNKELVAG